MTDINPETRKKIVNAIRKGKVSIPDTVLSSDMPLKGKSTPFNPRIRDIRLGVDVAAFEWASAGYGFGTIYIIKGNDGSVRIHDEHMSRDNVKKILSALVDAALFDSEEDKEGEDSES